MARDGFAAIVRLGETKENDFYPTACGKGQISGVPMFQTFSSGQIVLALLGIGLLIAWHELGHYWVARLCGMRVLKYSLGFGPKLISKEHNGITYQISLLPFGGYVQIKGMSPLEPGALEDPRSFIYASKAARIGVLLAGPAFNYLLALVLFFGFFTLWPALYGRVVEVSPHTPAAEAGIQADDIVVQINGRNLRTQKQLQEEWLAHEEIEMRLVRGANEAAQSLKVRLQAPRFDENQAPNLSAWGLQLRPDRVPQTPFAALSQAFALCGKHTRSAWDGLQRLVAGDPDVKASGPIGIVDELRTRAKRSAPDFLWLLAVLSVTLGFFNLLPIPALDGMKIGVILVEAAIRRPLNPVWQLWANALGMLFLIGWMLWLSVEDVMTLLGFHS